MRGFKSFADKTVVEFKQGVTCVVGPNGSGKSNITDAVRWVLGEQRIKTLRGSKMEDVIFNGTKHRKSLGLAEVKLVFDNVDHFFPLEYNEISVTRRVHRSGESEYQINGMPCRLKDIRELFMDTGIGREGYSIIGQGRIDEILSSNKDERRMLFEEAAGIIKYKSRKEESERKLKATHENLVRIQDILSEIEDRVEPLKLESERATRFLEVTETLKNIELNYFANRYGECEKILIETINEIRSNTDKIKANEVNADTIREAYNQKDQVLYRLNREIRLNEETFHNLQNQKSRTLGEKELIEEKISNAESNIKRIDDELSEVESEFEKVHSQIGTIQSEKALILEELRSFDAQVNQLNETLEVETGALGDIKTSNESERQEVIGLLNEIEIKKNENENLNRFKRSLLEKIEFSNDENERLNAQKREADAFHADYDQQLEALKLNQQQLQRQLSENLKSIQSFKDQSLSKRKQFERVSKSVTDALAEKKVLDTLEKEYDGYDKGVKDILLNLPDKTGIHGIVATLIDVPKKYETAIEVALGKSVQHIVCDRVTDAKRSIDYLRKNNLGRVTFLPLDNLEDKGNQREVLKQAQKTKGFIGVASDLLGYDAKYEVLVAYLLGRIMIVDTFETASEMIKIKNIKYKVITLNGDVLIPSGTITGGSFKSRISNILGRKRRIGELETLIFEGEGEQVKLEQELSALDGLIRDLDEALKANRQEIDQLKLSNIKLENAKENQQGVIQTLSETLLKLQKDLNVLKTELDETEATIVQNELKIEAATERVGELESKLSDVIATLSDLEHKIEAINEQITALKIKRVSTEQLVEFKDRELARANDDLKTIEQKKKVRQENLVNQQTYKETFYAQVDDIQKSIEHINHEIESLSQAIEAKQKEKYQLSNEVKAHQSQIAAVIELSDSIKEATHKLEVKQAKLEVEKETIIAELWDKYEITIGEAILAELVPVQKGEMKQLKQELKLIGSVNINAIKEYEEVAERYTFLTNQRKDLVESIEHLDQIILDLEKRMIVLFKAHFEIINEHFKGTFKDLFNGGDAELILSDYDDILNCDIDIIAQPPGKKLQSINLLSGGEKALTAIALLFAILKTKPTPFCILDEIEAALDDVNVYRFADFIKVYAEHSQFVVITHRKGTMEVADTLYGVTMEEYGVSKVLSVKLEDVEGKYN
ncbi:chromosome segregation protein SMC [Fusibacter sp. Q10-2]|uniref:Chromosome partition protein Smc n=2 Tax=Fusibacter ferrireducens TaxID=2785058 RepID=A0ABR9ZN05_9FIRM|nr:chromosome segregation protein SMC [Fusibacter ferrireducens]